MDRATRYDIHEAVQVTARDSGEEFEGVSLNISETGVLLRTHRMKPRGTGVGITFASFAVEAEIVWTREVGDDPGFLLGVKFTRISRKDRKTLNALLELPPDEDSESSFRWGRKARTPLGSRAPGSATRAD